MISYPFGMKVGSKKNPNQIGELQAWYDFSDLTTINKNGLDMVSQVTDKSGLGNTITSSGANQPVWVTNVLNSKSVIRFDGLQQFLTRTAIPNNTGDFTYFMVSKIVDNLGVTKSLFSNGDATAGFSYQLRDTRTRCALNNNNVSMRDGLDTGVFEIINVSRSSIAPLAEMFINNVNQVISGSTANYTPVAGNFSIGARFTTVFTEHLSCDVAELLIFNKTLNNVERNQVYQFLKTKWNL